MARFAVICTLVVVAVCLLGFVYTAPLENNKPDLAEKFIEFLKQDQQISELLQKASLHNVRSRRDTSMESVDMDTLDSADTGGFFDRAAKFVMEVLQRFLRWVNTEE